MYQLAPYQRDAKAFASQKHMMLVAPYGGPFRFEPTPNDLFSALEEGFLRGELSAHERQLAALETTDYKDLGEFMGDLHLTIMHVNNNIHDQFGIGKRIDGVEHWTEKYLCKEFLCSDDYMHEQSQQFVQ